MRPTNQKTTPTDNEHYEALKATMKSLKRCELESVALKFEEWYEQWKAKAAALLEQSHGSIQRRV
jgi:exo-beta-1,3-glucanase (GH17 family)